MAFVPGAGAGRKQVPLKQGFSLGHWVQKTGREGTTLNGQGGVTSHGVTVEELASHNSQDDIWMALNGLVYNITPYMPYHPGGGEELMRAAGGDGTRLFHEIHPWINIQSFLGKCYVGPLVRGNGGASERRNGPRKSPLSRSTMSLAVPGGVAKPLPPTSSRSSDHSTRATTATFKVPSIPPLGSSGLAPRTTNQELKSNTPDTGSLPLPRRDFYQTSNKVAIVLHGLSDDPAFTLSNVAVHIEAQTCHVTVSTPKSQYRLLLALSHEVHGDVGQNSPEIQHSGPVGRTKLVIKLSKLHEGQNWANLGSPLVEMHNVVARSRYQPCKIADVSRVTHDSVVLTLIPDDPLDAVFDLGQHVSVRVTLSNGKTVTRSYTPISLPRGSPPLQTLSHTPGARVVMSHESGESVDGTVSGSNTDVDPPDSATVTSVDAASSSVSGNESAGSDVPMNVPSFRLLVKIYPHGAVSSHLGALSQGDSILCSSPIGSLPFNLGNFQTLCFIAGGTGITPMMPIISRLLSGDMGTRGARGQLLFCNKHEDDILLRAQLDAIESDKFSTTHVLSQPSPAWTGHRGRINASVIQSFPSPDASVMVFVCGRTSFSQYVSTLLQDLGFKYHIFS
eukprot:m.497940 g.497940  ORF g.497940 m.497940 type:complete len:619 (+) comp21819_c0_seq5:277-2133(+)